MNKISAYYITFLILALFLTQLSSNVNADPGIEKEQLDEEQRLDKQYKKSGYISDKEAVEKFKSVYKQDPKISEIQKYIPFEISRKFGIFEKNGNLELEYLNTKSKALFKVMVFPIEQEIPLSSSEKIGKMEDGTPFSYKNDGKFYIFRFKTGKFAYVLSSNFLVENKNIKEKTFLEIANLIKNDQ